MIGLMKVAKQSLSRKSKIDLLKFLIFSMNRTSFISELTEADIQYALTPIHRIVFAVYFPI
jgi:hypothetical protein